MNNVMQKLCLLGIFISAPALYAETAKSSDVLEQQKPYSEAHPAIKVLVAENIDGAQIEVNGGHSIYDPFTGKIVSYVFGSSSFYMFPTDDGIRWGEEFPGVYQIVIVPKRGSFLVAGTEYKGNLYAYLIENRLFLVNHVSINDWADSMISTKIPVDVVDKEMLAALIIAARTEGMNSKKASSSIYFDIKAPLVNYQGAGVVRKDSSYQEALCSTKDMVLMNHAVFENIHWFEEPICKAPLEKMTTLSHQGLNGRQILLELYPDSTITLAR